MVFFYIFRSTRSAWIAFAVSCLKCCVASHQPLLHSTPIYVRSGIPFRGTSVGWSGSSETPAVNLSLISSTSTRVGEYCVTSSSEENVMKSKGLKILVLLLHLWIQTLPYSIDSQCYIIAANLLYKHKGRKVLCN